MRQKSALVVLVLAAGLVLAAAPARAQCAVSDNASDPAYNDGWQNGDNGGSGFQPWVLEAWGNGGMFVGTSVQNADGWDNGDSHGVPNDGDIDISDRSWGLYAGDGGYSQARRPFNAALGVGQTFTIDMDNGWLEQGRPVGFSLQNSAHQLLWEFFYVGWGNYAINDASGPHDAPAPIGGQYASEGMRVSLTLTSASTYSATITFRDGSTATVTGSLISQTDMNVIEVRLWNDNARMTAWSDRGGAPWDLFFNSMSIKGPGPSVACPADQTATVQCGGDTAVVTFGAPTISGGCPPYTTVFSPASGSAFGVGVTPVTCEVTDSEGLKATCGFSVTVTAQDSTPPAVSCPPAVEVQCPDSIPPVAASVAAFIGQGGSASDNCGGALTLQHLGDTASGAGCQGDPLVIARAYRIYDAALNYADCSQTIVQQDTIAPILSAPADVTLECGGPTDPSATGWASASDNCTAEGSVQIAYTDSGAAGECPEVSVITRTWTAHDACGNSASANQVIRVRDTTPPSLACNDPALFNAGFELGDLSAWGTFGNVFNENFSPRTGGRHLKMFGNWSAPENYSGIYQDLPAKPGQVWRASGYVMTPWYDAMQPGNEAFLKIEFLNASYQYIGTTESARFTADSARDVYVKLTLSATAPADAAIARIVVDFRQQNWAGGAAFFDDISLSVTTVSADGGCQGTIPDLTSLATASDGCGSVAVTQDPPAGTVVGTGATTVTLAATDGCGNRSQCYLTVNVVDDTPPVLTGPADAVIECDASREPANTGSPVVTDNCDGALQIAILHRDEVFGGACPQSGSITRRWAAIDSAGNFADGMQTITVQDTAAPALSGIPADLVLECADEIPPAPEPRSWGMWANSYAVAEALRAFAAPLAVGQTFVIDMDNGWIEEGYSVGFGLQSAAGDTRFEVIFGGGNANYTIQDGSGFFDSGVPYAGEGVHIEVTLTGPDTYSALLYRLQDGFTKTLSGTLAGPAGSGVARLRLYNYSAGNGTPYDADYNSIAIKGVASDTASDPVYDDGWNDGDNGGAGWGGGWTLVAGDNRGYFVYRSTANDGGDSNGDNDIDTFGVTTADNCDPHAAITFSQADNGASGCSGQPRIITRTWTAVDDCGNVSSQTQTITQEDTMGPALLGVPADVSVQCEDDVPAPATVSALDNCDSSVSVQLNETRNGGQITRTWTAADDCGNAASASQVITIQDTVPPVIAAPPAVTVECGQSTDPSATGQPTADDNCDTALDISYSDAVSSGACASASVIVRTWVAMDDAGNIASAPQVITVADTTPPVLAGVPADATVPCGSVPPAADVTASDACSGTVPVTFQEQTVPGSCPNASTVTRTWTAVDACGNVASATQVITVEDTVAPVITSCRSALANSSFEAAGALGVRYVKDWQIFGNGTLEATTPRSGAQHVKIWGNFNTPENYSGIYQDFPAREGQEWKATAYVLLPSSDPNGGDNAAKVRLEFFDASLELLGAVDSVHLGPGTPQDEYLELSVTGTAPAGAAYVRIVPTYIQRDNATGSAYFDDARLELLNGELEADSIDNVPAPDTTGVLAEDNCDAAPVITHVGDVQSGGSGCAGSAMLITRTYRATDACGNSSESSVTFRVEDDTAPVISCPSAGGNVAANAGFEATGTNLAEWATFGNAELVNVLPREGSFHAKIFGNFNGEENYSGVCQDRPASEGQLWRATVYILMPSIDPNAGDNHAKIRIEFFDADHNLVGARDSQRLGPGTPEDVYIQSSVTMTAPAGTEIVRLVPTYVQRGDATGCAYFDDARLELLDDGLRVQCVGEVPAVNLDLVVAQDNKDLFPVVTHVGDVSNGGAGTPADPLVIIRTFRATDSCGNSDECSTTITVADTTPPVIAPLADVTLSAGEDCAAVVPDLAAAASDNCSAPAEITIVQDPAAGTAIGKGVTAITVTATDKAGNEASVSVNVTVADATAPTIACPADITLAADANCQAAVPALEATVADNCSAAGAITVVQSPAAGTVIAKGVTVVTLTATDEAGNSANCSVNVTVADATVPTIACPADITLAADANCQAAVPALEATVADNCSAAGAITVVQSPAAGTLVGKGVTVVTLTATDEAGNSANCSVNVTVADATAPTIACPADITLATDADCQAVMPQITPAVADNCSAGEAISITQVPGAGALLAKGTTMVTLTAADEAGNLSSCTLNVTVEDQTAPEIACPADLTLAANANCQAVLPDLGATASDNCSLNVAVVQSPAAGTVIEKGVTVVTLTATDEAGNASSCSVNVTVADTTAPDITCPADVTLSAEAGCQAVVPALEAAVADNCSAAGAITVVQSPAAGTVIDKGVTVVTLTATDEAGNASSCSVSVTVVDDVPPVIANPGDQTVSAQTCDAAVVFEEPTATDNCDAEVTVTCSPASGSALGPGAHTITCTATDSSGNSSTATFTVTVLQPIRLVFQSPLEDDNTPDDIETDLDVVNKFKAGQTIPVKAKILDCSGNDVTTAMAPLVTVRIDVTERAQVGTTSTLINDLPELYNGVGDPAGIMVLVDGHLQFNLNTSGFASGTISNPSRFFRVHLKAEYNTEPFVTVGEEDATLESK